MAYLFRLIAILACVWSSSAAALVPTVTGYTYGAGKPVFSTRQAACDAYAVEARVTYSQPTLIGQLWNSDTGCRAIHPASGNTFGGSVVISEVPNGSCPVNSSPTGGSCQCNSPYVENSTNTACEAPPDPCKALKGQSAGTWWKDQGDDNGKPMKVGFSVCDRYNNTGGGLCVVTVGTGPDTLCVQAP